MKNRKSLTYSLIIAGISLAAVGASAFFSAAGLQEKTADSLSFEKTAEPGYIVRTEGNAVNVYQVTSEGETYSYSVENVNIHDLPESVKQSLKKGIAVPDETKLAGIIENLSS